MYKSDTLRLRDLILTRQKAPTLRLVKIFQKNKNIVYCEFYYNGTTQLSTTFTTDTLERNVIVSKKFNEKGALEYSYDSETGIWQVYDKKSYPFYDLQNRMKLLADKLVSEMYGPKFLLNQAVWNISGSAIYNANESGSWTDKFKKKPTKFLFRYDVKLDIDTRYKGLIEFELDEKGNFIPNEFEPVYGFEDVPDTLKSGFKLTLNQAIAKVKKLGLVNTDTTRATWSLQWESFRQPKLINGRFRLWLLIKTKVIQTIVPNGRSRRVTKYVLYRKKMTGLA